MKRLFMLFAMSIAMFSFAIERPSAEWNILVAKCSFDLDVASKEIGKLDIAKQPLFAVDVIKAITLYPRSRKNTILKLAYAVEKLFNGADASISYIVHALALDAIPEDFKADVIFMLNSNSIDAINPSIVHQTPNGHSSIWNAYLSTNRIDKNIYVPQSDIGVLRVPREGVKKNRSSSHHRSDEEPMPYWMQHL